MKLGENLIAASGLAPFFQIANPAAIGLAPPLPRRDDALRVWCKSMSGFQKEALVISARTGMAWRLVSDEGAYLNGYDAAPCPLAFLTCGMIASYMTEITALAAREGVTLRKLKLIQDNYYTIKGSMRQRTLIGGALPIDLTVEVDCDLPDDRLQSLITNAIHASPLNGLMRGKLDSLFALARNGTEIPLGRAKRLTGPMAPAPGDTSGLVPLESTEALITRGGLTPAKPVKGGTAGAATSLTDQQNRTLNPGAECTLREDGMKVIKQLLYSPHGNIYTFLSEEAPANGGKGRAPDANSLISAGIAFCFMTQFGRLVAMEGLDLPHYAIVQDTHFSLGGASGGTGRAGEADPVETHVFLETPESDQIARDAVDISEQTCFLHAFCRTDMKTKLRVRRL